MEEDDGVDRVDEEGEEEVEMVMLRGVDRVGVGGTTSITDGVVNPGTTVKEEGNLGLDNEEEDSRLMPSKVFFTFPPTMLSLMSEESDRPAWHIGEDGIVISRCCCYCRLVEQRREGSLFNLEGKG